MLTLRHLLVLPLMLLPLPGLAQEPEGDDPTVVGQVEHLGWCLVGPRGRHYVFGGLAMADYEDSAGKRRIVALQREEQIQDEKYLYYRELREGHRWALARSPGNGGTYGVWIQLAATDAAAKPQWLSFHRGRLETPREGPAAGSIEAGPACCGR